MAHQMETMFSLKERPWHGLGKVVHEAPSVADAIKLAGLDWDVNLQNLKTEFGHEVPGFKAVVRHTDTKILGVVGKNFTPLQNRDAFAFFDPFVQRKLAILETAGSLRHGSRIWILAKLAEAPVEIVKNDPVQPFFLLSNAHDGSMSVRIGFTPIRVVCQNTLSAAHQNGRFIRLTHGKKVKDNLDAIQDTVNLAKAEFEASAEQYRFLASRQISKADLQKYVNVLLPKQRDQRAELASEKLQARIEELFEKSPGADIRGVQGTWWAAYNAVNYYLNYEIGKNTDRRLNELWFGSLKRQNDLALSRALEMAHG